MSAHVESVHQGCCFDCGWEGPPRTFFSAADTDAAEHNQACSAEDEKRKGER
jgi:hypothetical protein